MPCPPLSLCLAVLNAGIICEQCLAHTCRTKVMCVSSQSWEVTSLLTQAVWYAETELGPQSRMSLWLSFSTTFASSPEPTREKGGSIVSARLLFPRGAIRPRALDGKCSWDTICSSSRNLEGGHVPVSSCALGYFLVGLFSPSGVSNCGVWS